MNRYILQNFVDEQTILSANHLKNLEYGIINLENEFIQDNHVCYCDFTDEVLSIVYHYTDKNDMCVKFKRKGPNSIVDILGWYLLPVNIDGTVQNDIKTGIIEVASWGSDFHGPFAQLKAKHNPLNDGNADENGIKPPGFTGGNHGYRNTGSVTDPLNTPTGRSGVFNVFCDGKPLKSGGMYCNRVNIYWENFVQGQNTVLPDGSGREVLKEIHNVTFCNAEFNEEVHLIPMEDVNVVFYYGIQGMTIQSVFGDSIYYGGSRTLNATRKLHATSVTAKSCTKDAYQAICTGPDHTLYMEIDPSYDMGNRWGYTVTTGTDSDLSSIECHAGSKLYFQLIRAIKGIDLLCGSMYGFRCKYSVKPTINKLGVRSINNVLTNVSSVNNIDVALLGSNTYLYFTANTGYTLPESISVENASYTWNKENGELILFDITADVKNKINISITGEAN